jgi:hypothetical protein
MARASKTKSTKKKPSTIKTMGSKITTPVKQTTKMVSPYIASAGSFIYSALSAPASPAAKKQQKGKGTGKKRMTVAKIKRKIALLKAKKELAKIRGY